MTSVIVGGFIFVINGNWRDFQTALLATGLAFGCFAVAHFLRAPWLIYKQNARGELIGPNNWAGVLGVTVIAALLVGGLQLGHALWNARPLGTIEATTKALPVPPIVQTRVVNVQLPCKLTPEQINPARIPQPCPGAPPPTLRDRVLAINAHLTEADRNRFSNALAEFSDSLNQGGTLGYKVSSELTKVAPDTQAHLKDLTAQAWKYQKAFPELRIKWDMFRPQVEYIFGDNPDNEGPNALINAAGAYSLYLNWWGEIPNNGQDPVLKFLTVAREDSQNYVNVFFKWQRACVARLGEMRDSIR